MAESLDKKNRFPDIHDDIIREALKTGLMGVEASEDLVRNTLAKCQNEIDGTEKIRRNTHKAWMSPWIYRLGAPLAAGALVLVLLIGGNHTLLSRTASEKAPQDKVSMSAATASGSEEANQKMAGAGDSTSRSAVPEVAFDAVPSPSPAPAEGSAQKSSDTMAITGSFGTAITFSQSINASSLVSRAGDDRTGTMDENTDLFAGIVEKFNSSKGTSYSLDKKLVTRVGTVIESGVTADMLLKAESYQEILSGKGYWMLPLEDATKNIAVILRVNSLGSANADVAVSSEDLLVDYKQEQYLVSEQPPYDTAGENKTLFDADGLKDMVLAAGYQSASEIMAVDIHYGTDFIVFVKADGKELGITFLSSAGLYGLQNQRIYSMDELVKIISETMGK